MDTNTCISVSIRDRYVRKLASRINKELIELRKERLRLRQGDQELKNAVTNIAHDLRTPLTAIIGYLELMEDNPADEKMKAYLEIVRERTDALKRLTEELFRYSVITSASEELCPVCLSLNRELEIALAGAYAMLTEQGISPEIDMPDEPVMRKMDQGALQRVFANILSNAAKYSDGDLKVVLERNGCITFKNRASHLSEVEAGKLFDRFYTVENAKGSTGLGLSIARLLTEKMGGSIKASWSVGYLVITLGFGK
ncbi:MAG: HAMP domain-containing histidine kinase [Blautia sp.]|nr:HAMP domain-containing histidine kinase [Blautia sp.]